jgi:HEPN domain-containing protein
MGYGVMNGNGRADYRFKLAQGFLDETRQDVGLGRWRSAMDNAQLAVENAAKAVLALMGPVGRTHKPAPLLRQALQEGTLTLSDSKKGERLAELAELLGFDVHVQTDYGDEMGGLTPWELFDEADANQALNMAEEAVALAEAIIQEITSQTDEGRARPQED